MPDRNPAAFNSDSEKENMQSFGMQSLPGTGRKSESLSQENNRNGKR